METTKRLLALILSLGLLFSATGTLAEADTAEEAAGVFGSPWVDSMVTGVLPAEAPDVKDDTYLYFNYEFISGHQGQNMMKIMGAGANLVADYAAAVIEDESVRAAVNGAYTESELKQLRIFYRQAKDLDTLKASGINELIQCGMDR